MKLPIDIIVSAAKFEALPILSSLKKIGPRIKHIEIGVGAINAAKNAAQLAKACKGKHVLFIGSAGIFGKFSGVQLFKGKSVEWLPTGAREGLGYSVPKDNLFITLPKPHLMYADIHSAHIICSSTVSLICKNNPKSKIPALENLELFSCAQEISESAKSFSVVLGITNKVGKSSHEQWLEHWKEASQMIANYIINTTRL
jgi:hypothetical protein